MFDIARDGGGWRVLATRSNYLVPWAEMMAACRAADIVVADRRLPAKCVPRWLKIDRALLARTGGLAITLGDDPRVSTVAARVGDHPWREAQVQRRFTARPSSRANARRPGAP